MTATGAWLLVAGLWAGCLLPGSWWFAGVGVAGLLVAATLPGAARVGAMVLAVLAVGSGLAGGRETIKEQGLLPALAAAGGTRSMVGTVVSEPREDRHGGAWFVVRVSDLGGAGVRERGIVRVDETSDAPATGQQVRFRASARPLGRDGFDGYLRRLHAVVALDADAVEVVSAGGPVLRGTTRVRERTRQAINVVLEGDRASLLAGLVLGDSAGRTPEFQERFAAAGLSHLVVVSGRHVAVLLAALLGLLAVVGVGARGRAGLSLAVVAWFAVLVRWQPSVLRAGVMAGLVLLAWVLGRGREGRHALGMAVLLLLLADPMLAGQLGFVLSVSATAGVLVAGRWLGERLPGPRWLRMATGVTVGAQLGAAPALLTAFGGVPLGAVPANLVAVPAAGVAQLLGLTGASLAQVSPGAAAPVLATARPFLAVVLWAGEQFSTGPQLTTEHLLSPLAVLFAAGSFGALLTRRRALLVALVLLVAASTGGVPLPWPRAAPVHTLTVTMLDVGQGDAFLVEAPEPGGRAPARLLVDGGPDPTGALRALRALGVDRLDAVALTHAHHDHSGGLPALLDALPVGTFVVGPDPLTSDVATSAIDSLAAARRRGVPVRPVAAGTAFRLGTARVEVLSPPADGSLSWDLNESSLVLRIAGRHGAVLLTGDAEVEAQRRLLRDPARLRATVLKVPHHGARTNADGFLAAVRGEVALIGVGDNDYGHPADETLEALASAEVYRADEDGTVRVELLADGPRASTPRGMPLRRSETAPRRPGPAGATRTRGSRRECCRWSGGPCHRCRRRGGRRTWPGRAAPPRHRGPGSRPPAPRRRAQRSGPRGPPHRAGARPAARPLPGLPGWRAWRPRASRGPPPPAKQGGGRRAPRPPPRRFVARA